MKMVKQFGIFAFILLVVIGNSTCLHCLLMTVSCQDIQAQQQSQKAENSCCETSKPAEQEDQDGCQCSDDGEINIILLETGHKSNNQLDNDFTDSIVITVDPLSNYASTTVNGKLYADSAGYLQQQSVPIFKTISSFLI